MGKVGAASDEERILMIVQATLVTKAGKPVFTPNQKSKMEGELGGVQLLHMSLLAQQHNNFDEFATFGTAVEDAEKN